MAPSHRSSLDHPSPLRTTRDTKASRLSGKAGPEAGFFEEMQGRGLGHLTWPSRSRVELFSLSPPLFLSQSHYFLCKKCRTIAAFANSFLPLVCHLWELRREKKRKKRLSKGEKKNAEKKNCSSSRGRLCFFFWRPSLFFSFSTVLLSSSLFSLKAQKSPATGAGQHIFNAAIPFFSKRRGGAFSFSPRKNENVRRLSRPVADE